MFYRSVYAEVEDGCWEKGTYIFSQYQEASNSIQFWNVLKHWVVLCLLGLSIRKNKLRQKKWVHVIIIYDVWKTLNLVGSVKYHQNDPNLEENTISVALLLTSPLRLSSMEANCCFAMLLLCTSPIIFFSPLKLWIESLCWLSTKWSEWPSIEKKCYLRTR